MKYPLISLIFVIVFFVSCTHEKQYTNDRFFPSGGLGLSRHLWEQKYGQAYHEGDISANFRSENVTLQTYFLEGNVCTIKCFPNRKMDLDTARKEIQKLLPNDALIPQETTHSPGSQHEFYFSESLKTHFGKDGWRGGKPGQFMAIYNLKGGEIEDFGVDTGW